MTKKKYKILRTTYLSRALGAALVHFCTIYGSLGVRTDVVPDYMSYLLQTAVPDGALYHVLSPAPYEERIESSFFLFLGHRNGDPSKMSIISSNGSAPHLQTHCCLLLNIIIEQRGAKILIESKFKFGF